MLSFVLSQFELSKLLRDGNITLTDAFPIEDDFINKLRGVRFKKTDSIFNHDPRKTRTHDPKNCRQQENLAPDLRKSLDKRLQRALRNLVSLLSDATLRCYPPMLPFRCYPPIPLLMTLQSHSNTAYFFLLPLSRSLASSVPIASKGSIRWERVLGIKEEKQVTWDCVIF